MTRFNITALAAALGLAMSAAASAAIVTKSEYKAAKEQITAKYQSDRTACKGIAGNAMDICIEEARGNEKVAKAELEASYKSTDKNRYDARLAKADATYAVAKEKCDDLAGNAKDVCMKEAKAAHVAAKADAKVTIKTAAVNATAREKKVDINATAREKTAVIKKDAAADKRDADYAVAKEKCDGLAGDVKANCIKDAKIRYGQT
jgi:hypothetical protein